MGVPLAEGPVPLAEGLVPLAAEKMNPVQDIGTIKSLPALTSSDSVLISSGDHVSSRVAMRALSNCTFVAISILLLAGCQTSPVPAEDEVAAAKLTQGSNTTMLNGGGTTRSSATAGQSEAGRGGVRSPGEATKDAIDKCGC